MKQLPGPAPAPSYNLEAEQAVLGSVLLKPEKMEEVSDLLLPEDFSAGNRLVYGVFCDLWQEGRPIDLVTVTDALKKKGDLEAAGGTVYISGLSEQVGTAANAEHYAQLVYNAATIRALHDACQKILADCRDGRVNTRELLDRAEAQIFGISQTYLSGKIRSLGDILANEKRRLASMSKNIKDGLSGINTGFHDLNNLTYGWQPGDMIVMGGRPGHGKTALGLYFAFTSAFDGDPAVVFSLEMTEGQLVQRLISLVSDYLNWPSGQGVSGDALRSGRLTAEDWKKIDQASQQIDKLPLWILDGDFTFLDIKALCRRIKAQAGGLGLVVIDYLQRVKPLRPGRSRYEEVSAISRSAKSLAKELHVPVLVNTQLNRKLEERRDRRPIMSDLRDSGEIEQDADCILFVYRDELYNEKSDMKGKAEILVRKQRSGRVGSFKLLFRDDKCAFYDFEEEDPPF